MKDPERGRDLPRSAKQRREVQRSGRAESVPIPSCCHKDKPTQF